MMLGIPNASWGTVDRSHVQTVVLVPSCGPFIQRLSGQGSWLVLFASESAGEVEVLVVKENKDN